MAPQTTPRSRLRTQPRPPATDDRSQVKSRSRDFDAAFIVEAVEVECLRREVNSPRKGESDRQFEYLLRRANLLTCLAERTGGTEDRQLAEKAWEAVRALALDWGRPRLVGAIPSWNYRLARASTRAA